MPGSYANHLEFECHDSDRRVASKVVVYGGETVEDAAEKFSRRLVCNIHVGAVKRSGGRSRYGGTFYRDAQFIDVTDPRLATQAQQYLANRKAAWETRQVESRARQEQERQRSEARAAQAWVTRTLETDETYTITRGSDMRSYDNNIRDGFSICKYDESGSWSTAVVRVNQNPGEPSDIGVNTTGSWSPAKARAIGQALIQAADLAAALDVVNGPK